MNLELPPLKTPATVLEWLAWMVTSPYKIDFLVTRSKNKYTPLNIWRVYHPAFWVVYWEITTLVYKQYGGRWLMWLSWSFGMFLETLLRGELPRHIIK